MGFPIRKSTDQSLFAAPRGLSQRTTSFIASQRQGIHRTPLRHLITLIVDARPPVAGRTRSTYRKDQFSSRFARSQAVERCESVRTDALAGPRTNLLFTMSEQHAAPPRWRTRIHACPRILTSGLPPTTGSARRLRAPSPVPADSRQPEGWWSQTGSNRRPPACKAGALPTELWPRQAIRNQRSEIRNTALLITDY